MSNDYTKHYDLVMKAMTGRGLLLGAYDAKGRPNLMTIGWGSIGSVWDRPVWTVLVRPSRYTFGCIEHSKAFSVCVPPQALADACMLCGSKSGRDIDKVKATGLTVGGGRQSQAPDVAECPIVYQCELAYVNDVDPACLFGGIVEGAERPEDRARIYYGKIVSIRVDPDAADRLKQ